MVIEKVEIKNFRSIDSLEFNFDKNFQILVGINESGKSNILKALSLLSKEYELKNDDTRDISHEEDPDIESYVRFHLKINSEWLIVAYASIKEKILTKDLSFPIIIKNNNIHLNLENFCLLRNELVYVVDIIKNVRNLGYFLLNKPNFKISSTDWKKVKNNATFEIEINGQNIDLKQFKIVNYKDYPEIPIEYLENLDSEDINKLFSSELIDYCKNVLPEVVFWNYSEDKLLPGRIDFDNFIEAPNNCQPLLNMFRLAGYTSHNLKKVLNDAKDKPNGIRNILNKVSSNTTDLLQSIWPELKNLKIFLNINGNYIETGIQDKYNIYNIDRRSDGFKRFFTFLLMISSQNKSEVLNNNLILIDEPDIALHPSGIQYLRDELIKIGINNKVVISTHSIFMIDKLDIDRHLIVKKENEITTVQKVSDTSILDEEVIFNALNFSLFDIVKPYNIIFEGWKDKKTFEMYIDSTKGKKLLTKDQQKKLGLMHSYGVKDLERVASFCENASRKFIIISDSDKPAKENQKKYRGNGTWYCYDDIENITAVTTEDFIDNKLINKAIKSVLETNLISLNIELQNSDSKDKVALIKSKLHSNNIEKTTVDKIVNEVKEYVCEHTKATDLDETYHKVFETIIKDLFI
jgi:predicted ATP-dependent endonuclease of OLD family